MHSTVYILALVAGVSGLWLLWDRGFRGLLLDRFREQVFSQRYALFQLGMEGRLDFNSDVYRQIETLLCGLLRYAHDMTFLTFISSRAAQEKARSQPDYVDISKEIGLKVSRLDVSLQGDIESILRDVRQSILIYTSFTSLLFVGVSVVVYPAHLLGLLGKEKAMRISSVVERQAYMAEVQRKRSFVTA